MTTPSATNARPRPAASRRRLWRRLVSAVVAASIAVLVAEMVGAVAWSALTGDRFTRQRARLARDAVRYGPAVGRSGGTEVPASEAEQQRAAQWAASHRLMLHPFLGYVNTTDDPASAPFPTSAYGFFDTEPPLRQRSPDRFVVGIVGGSVAAHFYLYGGEAFAAALRRGSALAGRDIDLVNLAVGGYKQPQQLAAVQLMLALGGEFDVVVNLDGFNEIALLNENIPLGVPGWYPRSWARLLDSVPTAEQQLRLGHMAVLDAERLAAAETAAAWSWSPLAQSLWMWSDRRRSSTLARLRAEAESAAAAPSPAIYGPGTGGLDLAAARREMVEVWVRSSRLLHATCEAQGIHYLHFLQPNQYVPDSKPIDGEEAGVAIDIEHPWRSAVLDGYPQLRQRSNELLANGVDFTDLTRVFADHPEPIYTDTCCHFERRGNAILAEHIAAAIRRRVDSAGAASEGLEMPPARVTLD